MSFRIRYGLFGSRQSFRHLTLQSPGDLWTLAWRNISSTFFFGKHWPPIRKPQSDFGNETCGATFWDLNSTGQCLNNYLKIEHSVASWLGWERSRYPPQISKAEITKQKKTHHHMDVLDRALNSIFNFTSILCNFVSQLQCLCCNSQDLNNLSFILKNSLNNSVNNSVPYIPCTKAIANFLHEVCKRTLHHGFCYPSRVRQDPIH